MTAQQRAVVDDLGNIAVHGRSGLVIVVKVETATEGVYEDISERALFFEVGGKIRLALSEGFDAYSRKIILTRTQAGLLAPQVAADFALHDETSAVPATLWSGQITTFGFRAAPTGAGPVEGEASNWTGGTVVIRAASPEPVVVLRREGVPGPSAIQVLIDSGDLPAGADADDLIELLRAPLLAGRLDFSSASNSALLGAI